MKKKITVIENIIERRITAVASLNNRYNYNNITVVENIDGRIIPMIHILDSKHDYVKIIVVVKIVGRTPMIATLDNRCDYGR